MQSIVLPGSPSTAEELWKQCLAGDCTDLLLCCDDGIVKTHKAILVSCLPWLKDTDTDTVIMPGISVEKLKEAIKEFYLTSESKEILWYFGALSLFQHNPKELGYPEVDQDIKKGAFQNVNLRVDQDMNPLVDGTYLEKGLICKSESDDTQFEPLLELEQNFNFNYIGDELATTSTRKRISQHKKLKDKEPTSHPCVICKVVFTQRENLRSHIKHVHSEDRPFVCEECGTGFKKKSNLEKHLSSVHGTSSFPCQICGKTFKSELYMTAHIRMHNPQVPCPFCDRKFVNKTILDRHNKSAHSDDRPFVCEECGMGFKRKNILENHLLSIHSTSSFPCGECGKLFKSEAYVASHMKAHDESSQFPCHFCTRKFVTRTKLKMHINTHTGETPYKCPHNCGKAFHSSDQLSHHKKQCKELILNK